MSTLYAAKSPQAFSPQATSQETWGAGNPCKRDLTPTSPTAYLGDYHTMGHAASRPAGKDHTLKTRDREQRYTHTTSGCDAPLVRLCTISPTRKYGTSLGIIYLVLEATRPTWDAIRSDCGSHDTAAGLIASEIYL
jgi:hypothetical protein